MALGSRTLPRHSLKESGGDSSITPASDLFPASYPGTLGRRHRARSLRLIEAALRNSGVFHNSCKTLQGLNVDQTPTACRASIRRVPSIKTLPQPPSSSGLPPRPVLVPPPTPPTYPRWTASQGAARMTRSVGPPTSSTPIVASSNGVVDMSQSFDMAVLEEDIVLSWLGQARLEEYHGHFILAGYDLPTITRFDIFTSNM